VSDRVTPPTHAASLLRPLAACCLPVCFSVVQETNSSGDEGEHDHHPVPPIDAAAAATATAATAAATAAAPVEGKLPAEPAAEVRGLALISVRQTLLCDQPEM
jgi:hypothetical protein